MLEVEQAALASHVASCCLLFVVPFFVLLRLGTLECWAWGGRQGGCGLELCVVVPTQGVWQPAGCVSCEPVVSVCRSCVSSSSVQRPPIPRWCPVRAWLFFTYLSPTHPHSIFRSPSLFQACRPASAAHPRRHDGGRRLRASPVRRRFRGRGPCHSYACHGSAGTFARGRCMSGRALEVCLCI